MPIVMLLLMCLWVSQSHSMTFRQICPPARFKAFVEGWTFRASYNQLDITLLMSPLAYSLQAMQWNDVPPITEAWSSTVSPTIRLGKRYNRLMMKGKMNG
jgi:hypothetical protein